MTGPAGDQGRPRYDAEHVAQLARTADPGLPEETARELAVLAGEHVQDMAQLDAPEIARRLMADLPSAGATPAAVVARAVIDHCSRRGITPGP
jgi:hypothetical protein